MREESQQPQEAQPSEFRSAPGAASTHPAGKPNPLNVAVWVLMAAVAGGVAWWMFVREAPLLTVRESGNTSGRFSVEGVVRPPLNEETLRLRAAQYRGTELGYFEVEDETGTLSVYFDPGDFRRPSTGVRVRVTGARLEGSGGDFTGAHPFLARSVQPAGGAAAR